jgi:hypothetical protein
VSSEKRQLPLTIFGVGMAFKAKARMTAAFVEPSATDSLLALDQLTRPFACPAEARAHVPGADGIEKNVTGHRTFLKPVRLPLHRAVLSADFEHPTIYDSVLR